ncbi:MAG: hypothetical protein QOE92_1407 [Chloroflexota bacterium]|nr:hypothetical protein [Chloroflexota bacterium]
MESTIAGTTRRVGDRSDTGPRARSRAWTMLLGEVTRALLMLDPMGFAWYWAMTRGDER